MPPDLISDAVADYGADRADDHQVAQVQHVLRA
jgi:hypothetical protein